ncbi:hypothetical protein PUN28_001922 [Cardiocondyla obscurior]|uniref:Uncharacterized protein n=1 Tax=Cardiocondyla obscurior TaxID=286306 RepID=A0AAW2GRQ1_9HYME
MHLRKYKYIRMEKINDFINLLLRYIVTLYRRHHSKETHSTHTYTNEKKKEKKKVMILLVVGNKSIHATNFITICSDTYLTCNDKTLETSEKKKEKERGREKERDWSRVGLKPGASRSKKKLLLSTKCRKSISSYLERTSRI